ATESIYVLKSALVGVEAFMGRKKCNCGEDVHTLFTRGRVSSLVAPARWCDKGEKLYMPMEHAAYLAKA
ncbi:MAG: hypothetical protein AB2556_20125, partial [Candidatus Thiodiazotropha sp.]